MNTKNTRNGKRISGLIAMIALLAAMSGCNQTTNTAAPANTPAPANIPAPANTSASNSSSNSTEENPATAFYGKWEKKAPGQPFIFEIFGSASKQGDNYVGKVTDQTNAVIATYTVFKNKTVELTYVPPAGSNSYILGYEFSDGGKKLTLDADPPIVYTKGTTNTNIEKDVNLFQQYGAANPWISAKDKPKGIIFANGQQGDKGWSGTFDSTYNGNIVESGTFEITEAGKMTLKPSSGSSTAYTYKFRGNLFDFTRDRDGDTDTYAPF